MAAESFLYEIAANVLMKTGSLAYRELSLSCGIESDLRKLEETLSIIKAVLLDAEVQQSQNHQIRIWLGKLKDIFYDAEDVLDEVECEALRRQVVKATQGIVGRSMSKVSTFFSNSNPVAFRYRIGHKMKEIGERLDEMAADKSKFHLTERVSVDSRFPYNMKLMISLRYLDITTCVQQLQEDVIGCLKSLRYLYIDNCFNLYLTRLEKLVIWDCPKLNLNMELQEEDPCLSLQTFIIIDLPALVDLPQLILQGSANTLRACLKLLVQPSVLAMLFPSYASEFGNGKLY
ncbi:hypothetical protein Pint_11998 [Pistacia integerrima]|uniref:Uncharacterized protein n=1 Tax=Pistacia integerrima TaxID=434235 RepID=A0ACC0XJ76_9ROSI|nr:hypothetical protein Pint_11998 [Pistacia integerrima]